MTFILIGATLFVLAIRCGGSSSDACIGKVTYEGKTFEGKGKNADEAANNACYNYCRDADPEFDARYHI